MLDTSFCSKLCFRRGPVRAIPYWTCFTTAGNRTTQRKRAVFSTLLTFDYNNYNQTGIRRIHMQS
jgi:hypothetical protein